MLPASLKFKTQVPAPTNETTPLFTVQTEVLPLETTTLSREVAVAVGVYVAPPMLALPGEVEVIVIELGAGLTVMLSAFDVNAGATDAAVIPRVPTPVPVKVKVETPDTALTALRPLSVPVPDTLTKVMFPT